MGVGLGQSLGASLAKGLDRLVQLCFEAGVIAYINPVECNSVRVAQSDRLIYGGSRPPLLILVVRAGGNLRRSGKRDL
jgi:hypothetical protein